MKSGQNQEKYIYLLNLHLLIGKISKNIAKIGILMVLSFHV